MVCDEYLELLLDILPRNGRVAHDVLHVFLAELDGARLILLLDPAPDGGSGMFRLNLSSGLLDHGHCSLQSSVFSPNTGDVALHKPSK